MFRNMTVSLVEHELIKTTLPKAKELRSYAEPLITLAKNDSVANRRLAFDRVRDKAAVGKLFSELGPRYQARPGGYIRIMKCGYRAGDKGAMSAQQVKGLELFEGKANCATCHVSFNFTDEMYHNLGVGWNAQDKAFADPGRFDVTEKDADKGKFKTPTLRNVAETAPYMHDGSEASLRDVMVLYNRGGNANPGLDEKMKPLKLSDDEIDALVAFMNALTGPITNAEPPPAGSMPQ